MRTLAGSIVLCVGMLALWGSVAEADPFISLKDGPGWSGPQIGPVLLGDPPPPLLPLDPADLDWYTLEEYNGDFYLPEDPYIAPQLYVYEGPLGTEPDAPEDAGLVMAWDAPEPTPETYTSAWKFEYEIDPDLSGLTLSAQVFGPALPGVAGVNDVGLALVDEQGLVRSWSWQFGIGSGQITNNEIWTLTTAPIGLGTPAAAANAGGNVVTSTDYIGAGFDPTKVVAILGIVDGSATASLPEPDPSQGTIGVPLWSWWGNLEVVPEPGSFVLLGVAFGCLGIRRRRRW